MSGGFPERAGRVEYGKPMRDERKVADPSRELGADVLNLLFWNLGAAGLIAPKVVLLFEPAPPAEFPKLVYGASSWDPLRYANVLAPFPWFTYTAPVTGSGHDMVFSYASPVTGMGGLPTDLELHQAVAQVVGIPGSALPSTRHRASATLESATAVRVTISNQSAENLLLPVALILF